MLSGDLAAAAHCGPDKISTHWLLHVTGMPSALSQHSGESQYKWTQPGQYLCVYRHISAAAAQKLKWDCTACHHAASMLSTQQLSPGAVPMTVLGKTAVHAYARR